MSKMTQREKDRNLFFYFDILSDQLMNVVTKLYFNFCTNSAVITTMTKTIFVLLTSKNYLLKLKILKHSVLNSKYISIRCTTYAQHQCKLYVVDLYVISMPYSVTIIIVNIYIALFFEITQSAVITCS